MAVGALPAGDHELADAQRAVDDPDVADPAVPDLVDGSAVLVTAEAHGRGGWYTLQFAAGDVVITSHDPVPL